eukprot:g13056.t1
MSDLTALKVRKLGQQQELAEEFNLILTRQGGLNDQARQICKNLEYAIAIATRPGQIEYYRPSEEAKRIVENGELAALTHKIARLQREIDQVGVRRVLDQNGNKTRRALHLVLLNKTSRPAQLLLPLLPLNPIPRPGNPARALPSGLRPTASLVHQPLPD